MFKSCVFTNMESYRCVQILYLLLLVCVSFKNGLTKSVFTMTIPETGSIKQKVGNDDTYMQRRNDLLTAEQNVRVGGEIVLTANEKKVNEFLLKTKKTEMENSHYNGQPFAPQINFLKSKSLMEKSNVFNILKNMPKGGALHVHDCSIASITWLVMNVTYRDNCYMCHDVNNSISYKFFKTPPANPGCPWKLVSAERQNSPDVTKFDAMLVASMILTEDYANKSINVVWRRFEGILVRANGLINYAPVFRDYFYEALKEMHDDNVQYMEIRGLLPQIYELDGSVHDARYTMGVYKNTTQQFVQKYTNFTGAKIIKTSLRFVPPQDILADVKTSIALITEFPDHFAGYDMVGQEDPGEPLLYYLDALRYPALQTPPIKLPYFFHAGETYWQGTRVDDNLIDAVLLNTTRLGHAYALTKHPEVMKIVKQNGIPIEVNPISNQVLKLVDNLQNHPAASLLAQGFPVVISCDDPAVWGAKGLTYDFYVTFMAMDGQDDGLKLLKQLAINSLTYSSLSVTEKVTALKLWQTKWDSFINDVVSML